MLICWKTKLDSDLQDLLMQSVLGQITQLRNNQSIKESLVKDVAESFGMSIF